jgi:flagellar basal-body rod protein FlgB
VELFTDLATSAIERALDGVATRQRVSAHNIANVATPGFRASRVSFEQDLAGAIGRGAPGTARTEVTAAGTPARADGNNVVLEDETQIMITSGLQYEALVQALNYKLSVLRTAIGG